MATSASAQRAIQPRLTGRDSLLRPKYLLFGFIGLMVAYVLVHDENFLINAKDSEWQHIQTFKWWLLPHGIAGATAFFLGVTQFSDRLRLRFTWLHHVFGYTYICCTFIAAPLGLYIEYFEERLGAGRSFTIATMFQSGLWMLTTAIALAFILKGRVQEHRQWMTRSFGTGPLIFLGVRVISGLTGWENLGPHAIEIIDWGCIATCILAADLVLQAQDMLRTRAVRAKAQRDALLKKQATEASV